MSPTSTGAGRRRDPFDVLEVSPSADADELRAARRRLAKELHPDRSGGDESRMRELNIALDAALAVLDEAPLLGRPSATSDHTAAPAGAALGAPGPTSAAGAHGHDTSRRTGWRYAHDVASFTIEALPAEAFDALLTATTRIGGVLVDDPPYQLEVELGEPFDCWCRLDLIPDAGSATVSLTLAARDGRPVPDIDAVRDTWVATLNQLGRPTP